MTTIEVSDAFTQEELEDITGAAEEHGMTIWEIIHNATMEAIYA